jgi:hypothetical protein
METSTATEPAYLGSMNEPEQGDATQPLFGALNGAKGLLTNYATRSRAIRNASDLGDYVAEARMRIINQRLGDLANEVLTKASRYDSIVIAARAEVASLENSLAERKVASDPVSLQRADWILEWFDSLPAEQKITAVKEALDATQPDLEVLQVLLGAPRCFHLVPDGIRSVAEQQMLASKNPLAYQNLVNLRQAVRVVTEALDRLRSFINGDAGRASS